MEQSRGLRESASVRDAVDRAKSYNLALNLVMDLSDRLTLTSHTAWNWDSVYSVQDDNRFNTVPIFSDTSNLVTGGIFDGIITPSEYQGLAPGGILCDPQIGCSKTLGVFDISSADSKQFAQELRLQSSFDGPFNFSRSEEHTSELQSLMRISYAVFCLKKKTQKTNTQIALTHYNFRTQI